MNLTTLKIPSKLLSWGLYLGLSLVLVFPFLEYHYLFAADQYVHSYNACILEELRSTSGSIYENWFRVNTFPEPNLMGHALLWVLAKALPMHLAEKAFVFLLLLGNGYAFLSNQSALVSTRNAATTRSIWPLQTAAAIVSLIFFFGAIWQLGFINYLLGMVGVIVGLTYTAKLNALRSVAVLGVSLFTYFCHPIAFLFFMGTFSLRELLQRKMLSEYLKPLQGDWLSFIKSFTGWFGLPMVAFVSYVATHSEVSTFRGASPWRIIEGITYHNQLALFTSDELLFAKLTIVVTVVLMLWGVIFLLKDKLSFSMAFIGATVLAAAIVLSPDYFAGGAFIHHRLIPFFFIWVLWSAAHTFSKQLKAPSFKAALGGYALLALSALSITGLTFHRSEALPAIVDVLDEYKAFSDLIPERSVVLPVASSATSVVKGNELSLKPVLHHYASILDCSREVVLLDNYEAYVGYFPLLWRGGKNPFVSLTNGVEMHPASIPASGKEWILANADYLLAMGPPEEAFTPETLEWIEALFGERQTSLNGNFHLIKVRQ